jgi:hypothetical protein
MIEASDSKPAPAKLTTFQPQANGLIQIKNSINSANSTPNMSPISSAKKRSAPIAPTANNLVISVNESANKEPVVKIKDNQLKGCKPPIQQKPDVGKQQSSLSSSTKSNKSGFSTLSSASNSTNGDEMPLSSSSSSSSSSSNKSKQIDAEAGINDSNEGQSTSNKNANNYCSTSSVSTSSAGSVVSSTSSPPSPPMLLDTNKLNANTAQTAAILINSPGYYNNIAYEELDSSAAVLLNEPDFSHREMAIDCPDNFVPEVVTRPWKQQQQQQPELKPSEKEKEKKASSTLEKQKNILKPLLSIGNKSKERDQDSSKKKKTKAKAKSDKKAAKQAASSNSEHLNTSEMQLIHKQVEIGPIEPEEETNLGVPEPNESKKSSAAPLSASLSSIQFIDEETRSRANLNSSYFIHNNIASDSPAPAAKQPANKLQSLTDEINDNTNSKVSLGKKLFEKQRQHFEEANLEEAVNQQSIRFGITNNCFVMDHDDVDVVELEGASRVEAIEQNANENLSKAKVGFKSMAQAQIAAAIGLNRPPTPPPRSDTHLSCFNVVNSVNSVDIEFDEGKRVEQQTFSSTLDVKLFDSASQTLFESESYFKSIQTKSFEMKNEQTSPISTSSMSKSISSSHEDKSEEFCFNPNKPLGIYYFLLSFFFSPDFLSRNLFKKFLISSFRSSGTL